MQKTSGNKGMPMCELERVAKYNDTKKKSWLDLLSHKNRVEMNISQFDGIF